MDRGAWHATVHGVAKSRTRLSNFTLTFTCTSTILCSMLEFLSSLPSLPVLGFKKNLPLSLASPSQPPGFKGYVCEVLSVSSSVSVSTTNSIFILQLPI